MQPLFDGKILLFNDLEPCFVEALNDAGYEEPTDVQRATRPFALAGEDMFVSAETGSGKTAAYLLPCFEALLDNPEKQIKALVLVPTRELAQQVLRHAKMLARLTDIRLGHIGGGTDIKKQSELIRQPPQFLVATPGRLSGLLGRDHIDLSEVEILILDEADRMLDMGFSDEILAISDLCLARRQTQLYSATLANKALRGLADRMLDDPTVLELNQTSDKHAAISQEIIYADDKAHKFKLLTWLLKNESYRKSIVFCNSKEQADQVFRLMQQQGLTAGILHGDRDQKSRNLVMSKLRRDELNILIATDVVARGLDLEGLDLVINFEMPRRGELYVHRIGRTGRAGKQGSAITLISPSEYNLMAGIERFLKQKFDRRTLKELAGHYKGPKKTKASGKAVGPKKKKTKKNSTAKKPVKKLKSKR